MQKWERRYALLLLLLLLVLVVGLVSGLPVKYLLTDTDCKTCETNNCTSGNYIEEADLQTSDCRRCSCLSADKSTASIFERYTSSYLEDVAFLSSTEKIYQLGKKVTFSCQRWYTAQNPGFDPNPQKNYVRRKLLDLLPTLAQQSWYVAKFGTTVVTVVNATSVVDGSTMQDDLECRANKNKCDMNCSSIPLFPSKAVVPVITGPKSVKPETKPKWTCTVDFMPVRTGEQDFDFAFEIINSGYLHVEVTGPELQDKKFKLATGKMMTVYLELLVPPRLVKTFFEVQCSSIHRFTGEITHSEHYRVQVPESTVVRDLTKEMTALGGVFGALAVIVLVTFMAVYCSRKKLKLAAASKDAEAGSDKQTGKKSTTTVTTSEPKPSGILKPALKPALKQKSGTAVDSSKISLVVTESTVDSELSTSVAEKTDKDAKKSTDKDAKKSTDKDAEKSTDKDAEKSTDKDAEKSTDKDAEKSKDAKESKDAKAAEAKK